MSKSQFPYSGNRWLQFNFSFQLAYFKYWPYENVGFAFISFRYTITDIQTPETV